MCTPYFKCVYSSKNKPTGQTGEARNRPYTCGSQINADTHCSSRRKRKNPTTNRTKEYHYLILHQGINSRGFENVIYKTLRGIEENLG